MIPSSCSACGLPEADPSAWRCGACEGALELAALDLELEALVDTSHPPSRYAGWLGFGPAGGLGEMPTPLVGLELDGRRVEVKIEGSQPTGSFKDRGTGLLAAVLRQHGVTRAIEDSSGNAGASLAAYSAHAGMELRLFVPETAPAAKLVQARLHGATVIEVEGPRQAATDAARRAIEDEGAVYASHLWNPWFNRGVETFAYELWEQLGCRAPGTLILPVGAGSLALASYRAFRALLDAGLVDRLPMIVGVQAAAFAPLERAFASGSSAVQELPPGETAADGILVARPPRAAELLAAVRATGGSLVAVDEDDLWRAHADLARCGLLVEPTSAVALAGLRLVDDPGGDPIVLALTGHGLKAATMLAARYRSG